MCRCADVFAVAIIYQPEQFTNRNGRESDLPNLVKLLEHCSQMREPPSGQDSAAVSARLPQLDPHAVWAQGFAGKPSDRPAGGTLSRDLDRSNSNTQSETQMAEPQFATNVKDDLPRTLRRERDARRSAAASGTAYNNDAMRAAGSDIAPGDGPPVTVTAFDVPFLKMVTFSLKAAIAAVPALIVLGLMMFAIGQVAQMFLPWLVKMRIVIQFPG